jgi:hypothetical protein
MTTNESALKNRDLLQHTNLALTRPERINSFEVGYKSVLLQNTLTIDIDAYINEYDGFLGQVEVAVPYLADQSGQYPDPEKQLVVGSDDATISMIQANRTPRQVRYRVYTNAKNTYRNYGSCVGLTYNFYKKFTASGTVNYNDISENKAKDVFVTGFNTPRFAGNIAFGNREVVKNFGFNVVWRWQNSFQWESPLANGIIPAYHTFDAQVTYKLPAVKSSIKLGGTNIFNNRYIQYAAGPTIGGLYYVSVTIDGLLNP